MGETLARTEEALTLNSNEWVPMYKVHGRRIGGRRDDGAD